MRRAALTFGLAAGVALAGCGNDQAAQQGSATFKQVVALAKGAVSGPSDDAPAAPTDPAALGARTLASIPDVPLQLMMREAGGAVAVTSVYGSNGDAVTWVTGARQTMSFDGPMLTATRGFGNDLMSVEDGGAAELIAARQAGEVQKTYRFLDWLDNTARLPVSCTIAPAGRERIESGEVTAEVTLVTENCASTGTTFANAYWIDGEGRMVQSLQWAGGGLGRLVFRRLRY